MKDVLNQQHATIFAVEIFGSVHFSSLVPDSKFQTKGDSYGDQKQCLELFCLQQRGKRDVWFKVRNNVAKY